MIVISLCDQHKVTVTIEGSDTWAMGYEKLLSLQTLKLILRDITDIPYPTNLNFIESLSHKIHDQKKFIPNFQ